MTASHANSLSRTRTPGEPAQCQPRSAVRSRLARRPGAPAGAALLTALLIVTLVTTLAAAMLWRQARSIQIESAERGRSQSDWVLQGALDWARLILREDQRANNNAKNGGAVDYNGEVWAVPLAEAQLASFLSTNDNHSADGGPDAYLSGRIEDAQGRYNLYNLIAASEPENPTRQLDIARKLFSAAGLSGSLADQIQKQLREAFPTAKDESTSGTSTSTGTSASGNSSLLPTRLDQLAWLGLSQEQIERLRPLVSILPPSATNAKVVTVTLVNFNTAPREVLAALDPGMSLSVADQIVRAREAEGLTAERVKQYLPTAVQSNFAAVAGPTSQYFYVTGQLRIDDRRVTMRSLVWRDNSMTTRVLDRQYIQQSTPLQATSGR